MITHFDMSSGELIEQQDRDPVGPGPSADREPQTALRLATLDEAVALESRPGARLTPDVARMPVAVWLRKWR